MVDMGRASDSGPSSARGRLYAGTSGFAYRAWVPRFYPPGPASRRLLPAYAARLPAVELNNTFYRRPRPEQVADWLRDTPAEFRFCPKAQRGASWRAWRGEDPTDPVAWAIGPLAAFGERLGPVLISVPAMVERDDVALARLLAAWPPGMLLALELPHQSWADDAVHEALRRAGAALVATDRDERDDPDLRRMGRFLYVRLRRRTYDAAAIERWARRLEPFLADGLDVFAFFRHDEVGQMALNAEALLAEVTH
jgi:uncharacterized protein YecE (DUF72 family)